MSDQPTTVRLALQADDDATPEELERLTAALREDLLALDVDQVTPAPGGAAPEGAKAVELAEIGALLITLVKSPALLGQIADLVRGWVGRRRSVEVSLEIGGAKLTMRGGSAEDTRRLVDAWIEQAINPSARAVDPDDEPPDG